MPTYEYNCDGCGRNFEVRRSIKDDPLKQCPYCSTDALQQVYHAPTIISNSEPRTIGGLADRNSAKMGRYEKEAKVHEAQEQKKRARREAMKQLPAGMTSARTEPAGRPFWRPDKDKPDLKLARLSTEKWKKYLEEGKK